MDFKALNKSIPGLDEAAMTASQAHWNRLAKPVGSLGRLEQAVIKIAGLTGKVRVRLDRRLVLVMCADNGVVAEGVSQAGCDITSLVAGNIARGRSAVCRMANLARAEVIPVDLGMVNRIETPGLLDRRIVSGTGNIARGPAMTRGQALEAIRTGMELAAAYRDQGYAIFVTGEMGIGNTTTSSAMASVLLKRPAAEVTGRGAGLSDAGLDHKIEVIEQALAVNSPDPEDALEVLSKLGGLDIAGMAGVFLGGALHGVPVLIDGLISAVSALIAARLCPASTCAMLAGHLSAEPAAGMVLEELGLRPLIKAEMRLGEGTGAVAALPLLDMALAVYHEMSTFEAIGMENYTPSGGYRCEPS